MTDKRLIEDSLPLEAISRQSAREKSIRHGHISTLHIWWARRPLAAMRAAIFASLVPAPKDDAERDYLHELIADIVDWDSVKNGNSKRVIEARDLIQNYHPDGPPKVLDPFMGGGSTGLEALRLGCEAHGVELNPVAYLIELCTLVYPQKYGQPKWVDAETGDELPLETAGLEKKGILIQNPLADDVRKWGKWVLEEARKEIGHLYEDPFGHTIVAYIWARTATCPNPACGAEMPMLRQTWLANKANKKVALRMLVDQAKKEIHFEVVEGDAIDFDPTDMTMRRGTIKCPVCKTSPDRDYLKTEGKAGRLGERMLAVVYTVEGQTGKKYRLATEQDMAQFEEAREMLKKVLEEDPDALPTEPIPSHSSRAIFVHLYGLTKWGDLFNSRQSLFLTMLAKYIAIAHCRLQGQLSAPHYIDAIASYMSVLLNRFATVSSTLCRWNNIVENAAGVFARQALPMLWDYAETVPLSVETTSSSKWIDSIVLVLEHCAHSSLRMASLTGGTATNLQIQESCMDAVVTDPPYYDAVPYADLSDFYYVWLKRSWQAIDSTIVVTPLTPKRSEIIQEPARHKNSLVAKQYYEDEMTKAFAETQRVLRGDGIFVVVFAHKATSAWETMLASLLEAGLVVTASWPLQTERPGRPRAQDSAALASSIFIVCRKRVTDDAGQFDSVRRELLARVKERLDFFWAQGIRGADFFISAIGPAVEVFGKYSVVRKLSGDEVGVAELLDLVQESVADYTLSRVLNGRYQMGAVDAPTRFYVMYRWSYNKQRLDFDDGRRLAQALGAEVDGLIRVDNIVRQRGAKITVPDSSGRMDEERLGELNRDGDAAPLINLLHRSLLIWQKSGRQELADFLALHGQGREDAMHVVAQSIVSVLPDNDEEKRTLENYLQGSDALPDARQGRLV